MDGDIVFAASTAKRPLADSAFALAELGALAANVLARAVARAVYEATALPFTARKRRGGTNSGGRSRARGNAAYMNRSARYGAGSVKGVFPVIISPISRRLHPPSSTPVAVAERKPEPLLSRRAAQHRQ